MPRRSSKPVLGFEAGRELRFPVPRGERSEAISWSGVRTNAVKEPLLLRAIIRALQDADDRAAGLQGRGRFPNKWTKLNLRIRHWPCTGDLQTTSFAAVTLGWGGRGNVGLWDCGNVGM
jgi:hypothetical protein